MRHTLFDPLHTGCLSPLVQGEQGRLGGHDVLAGHGGLGGHCGPGGHGGHV